MLLETQLGFHNVLWYYNIYFYLFVSELMFTGIMSIVHNKRMRLNKAEMKLDKKFMDRVERVDS